jgi:hypothetical protein
MGEVITTKVAASGRPLRERNTGENHGKQEAIVAERESGACRPRIRIPYAAGSIRARRWLAQWTASSLIAKGFNTSPIRQWRSPWGTPAMALSMPIRVR